MLNCRKKLTVMEKLFQAHPIIALICSVSMSIMAEASKSFDTTHIPEIVMQIGQLIAWAASVIIAIITAHGWYVKRFKKDV